MKFLSFLLVAFLFVACNQPISTIYEWRGPNRSGVYNETNLLKSWNDSGPALVWETNELGTGFGSPTVTENKLYVVGTTDSVSYLYAFTIDGNLLYKTSIGKEWVVNFPGSRTTPTVVGDNVYVITGEGNVTCLDEKSGRVEWQHNMVADFKGVVPVFGFSESLAVDGDLVFCCPGGPEHNVIALNRFSGELIWSCAGKGERSAYHSPAIIQCGTRKILTAFSAYHLLGIDAKTGKLLWTHEQLNTPVDKREPGTGDTHANTILFEDNILYYVEGDGNCAVALQLNNDGTTIDQLWNNAAVDNYMGGIVKCDQFIYSCAFSENNLVKVDARSGSVLETIPLGRGSVVAANNLLFYYNFKGVVNLIDIQHGKFQLISTFNVTKGNKEHFAHLVIRNGILYIRHGDYLGAYRISA